MNSFKIWLLAITIHTNLSLSKKFERRQNSLPSYSHCYDNAHVEKILLWLHTWADYPHKLNISASNEIFNRIYDLNVYINPFSCLPFYSWTSGSNFSIIHIIWKSTWTGYLWVQVRDSVWECWIFWVLSGNRTYRTNRPSLPIRMILFTHAHGHILLYSFAIRFISFKLICHNILLNLNLNSFRKKLNEKFRVWIWLLLTLFCFKSLVSQKSQVNLMVSLFICS